VNGQFRYLSASKIKHNGIPELQIIISFNEPENAQKYYRERRQIETAFRALKSSGFNIEDTHLTDLKRIEKLFSIVWWLLPGRMSREFASTIVFNRH
jgi:transposase